MSRGLGQTKMGPYVKRNKKIIYSSKCLCLSKSNTIKRINKLLQIDNVVIIIPVILILLISQISKISIDSQEQKRNM